MGKRTINQSINILFYVCSHRVLQTHVTFCEYLVFHEFKRNLYITRKRTSTSVKEVQKEASLNVKKKKNHLLLQMLNLESLKVLGKEK